MKSSTVLLFDYRGLFSDKSSSEFIHVINLFYRCI